MAGTFIEKITDEKQRRLKIDKDVWDELGLKKGDYVKVTIEKVKV
jgi:formylmethanofuran dehydrogenase subunit D